MLKIDDSLSVRLTNLTFVCTMLVLLLHLPYAGFNPNFLQYVIGRYTYLAVPTFFGISGFLLAKHCNEEMWYVKVLKKRFFSLVIPYIAFCALYIVPIVIRQNFLHNGNWPNGAVCCDWYAIKRIFGLTPAFHPACGPFWYIRCLLFFVLLSPLVIAFLRISRSIAIVTLMALSFGVASVMATTYGRIHADFFYSFFCLRGLVSFCCGMALFFWGVPLNKLQRWGCVGICVVLGEFLRAIRIGSPLLDSLRSLAACLLLVFALVEIMPARPFPKILTSSSFAMFALHMLVYMLIAMFIDKIGRLDGALCELLSLMPVLLAWATSVAFAFVVKRYIPMGSQLFFGGR